jgi:alkyl hydroperoxide reductase subunit F
MEFILPAEAKEVPVEEDKRYDLLIIGAGPAGMTAAVYAARKKLDTLVISKDVGGQTNLASSVETYMGYHYISGAELMQKFEEQVRQFPIALSIGDEVTTLLVEDTSFAVVTAQGKTFRGKAVIIASGRRARSLNVPREKELIGRGVSYCATCDAPLFGGMDVAVIGSGNPALTAVNELTNYARKIYNIVRVSVKADPILVEKAEKSGKVEFLSGYAATEIRGKERVEGIVIRQIEDDKEIVLDVNGVFIEIGAVPNTEFAVNLVTLNDVKEIEVDCECMTNILGLFAAGDVTNAPGKQIIVAAGEGAKAALSAYRYLVGLKED